jgi:hypothetical protein
VISPANSFWFTDISPDKDNPLVKTSVKWCTDCSSATFVNLAKYADFQLHNDTKSVEYEPTANVATEFVCRARKYRIQQVTREDASIDNSLAIGYTYLDPLDP